MPKKRKAKRRPSSKRRKRRLSRLVRLIHLDLTKRHRVDITINTATWRFHPAQLRWMMGELGELWQNEPGLH